MDNSKSQNPIILIGVGITVGGILVFVLMTLGARLTGLSVGPMVWGFPTETAFLPVQPTSVQQITQQSAIPTAQALPATVAVVAPRSNVQLVVVEKTGAATRKTYSIDLSSDEVIVGDAYDFQDKGYTCVVFLISGPGSYQFAVLDGAWYKYSGVTTDAQAEELLQGRVQYLQSHWFCKNVAFPVERIGE